MGPLRRGNKLVIQQCSPQIVKSVLLGGFPSKNDKTPASGIPPPKKKDIVDQGLVHPHLPCEAAQSSCHHVLAGALAALSFANACMVLC